MLYKVIEYNSIHNNGNSTMEYDFNIIKITTTYSKAIELALKLKLKTGKLYKVERV